MKKLIYGRLFFTLVGMIIVGCQKENTIQPNGRTNTSSESLSSYLKVAGEEHNRGLDYVYEQLKAEKVNLKSIRNDKSTVLRLSKNYTKQFLEKSEVTFVKQNIENTTKEMDISFALVSKKENSSSMRKNGETNKLWSYTIEDSLSFKQKELLTMLSNAVDDNSLDLQQILKVFEDVKIRAKTECSQEEYYVILAAIEIGKSSLTYWFNNHDKWIDLANEGQARQMATSFNWREVGKVDVASGVGAAAATGVVALFGPVGWGVFAGATLGGAVGGSVTDIILQLW